MPKLNINLIEWLKTKHVDISRVDPSLRNVSIDSALMIIANNYKDLYNEFLNIYKDKVNNIDPKTKQEINEIQNLRNLANGLMRENELLKTAFNEQKQYDDKNAIQTVKDVQDVGSLLSYIKSSAESWEIATDEQRRQIEAFITSAIKSAIDISDANVMRQITYPNDTISFRSMIKTIINEIKDIMYQKISEDPKAQKLINDLSRELIESKEENLRLRDNISKLNTELSILHVKMNSNDNILQERLSNSLAEIDKLNAVVAGLEANKISFTKSKEAEIEQLNATIQRLTNEVSNVGVFKDRIEQLIALNQEMKNIQSQLINENNHLRNRKNELLKQINQFLEKQKQNLSNVDIHDDLIYVIDNLKHKYEELANEEAMSNDIILRNKALGIRIEELEKINAEISRAYTAEKDNSKTQAELIESLNKQLEDSQAIIKEKDDKIAQLSGIEKSLENAQNQIDDLQSKYDNLVKSHEIDANEWTTEREQLQQQAVNILNDVKADNFRLQDYINNELKKLIQENENQKSYASKWESKYKNLLNEYNTAIKLYNNNNKKIKILQAQLTKFNKELEDNPTTISNLNKRNQDLEQKLQEAENRRNEAIGMFHAIINNPNHMNLREHTAEIMTELNNANRALNDENVALRQNVQIKDQQLQDLETIRQIFNVEQGENVVDAIRNVEQQVEEIYNQNTDYEHQIANFNDRINDLERQIIATNADIRQKTQLLNQVSRDNRNLNSTLSAERNKNEDLNNELNEMEIMMRNKDDELDRLKAEKQQLEDNINHFQELENEHNINRLLDQENVENQQRINDLSAQYEQLKAERDNLEQNIILLQTEIQNGKNRIQELEAQINSSENNNNDNNNLVIQNSIRELNDKVKNLETERDNIRAELEEARNNLQNQLNNDNNINSIENELNNLREQLEHTEFNYQQEKNKLENCLKDNERLQELTKQLKQGLNQKPELTPEIKQQMEDLINENNKLNEFKQQIAVELNLVDVDIDNILTKFKEEIELLKISQSQNELAIEGLHRRLEKCQQNNQNQDKTNRILNEQLANQHNQIEELIRAINPSADPNANFIERFNKAKELIQTMNKELNESEEKSNSYVEQVAKLEKEISELESLVSQSSSDGNIQSLITKKNNEINELKQQIQTIQDEKSKEITKLQTELEQVKRDLSNDKADNGKMLIEHLNEKKRLNKEIENLKAQINNEQLDEVKHILNVLGISYDKNDNRKNLLLKLNEAQKALKDQINKLNALLNNGQEKNSFDTFINNIEQLQQLLIVKEKTIEQLQQNQSSNSEIQTKLNQLNQEYEEQIAEIVNLQKQLDAKKNLNEKLENENNNISNQLQQQEDEIIALKKENNDISNQIKEKEDEITTLKAEKEKMASQLQNLEKSASLEQQPEINALKAENNNISNQLQQKQQEINALKAENNNISNQLQQKENIKVSNETEFSNMINLLKEVDQHNSQEAINKVNEFIKNNCKLFIDYNIKLNELNNKIDKNNQRIYEIDVDKQSKEKLKNDLENTMKGFFHFGQTSKDINSLKNSLNNLDAERENLQIEIDNCVAELMNLETTHQEQKNEYTTQKHIYEMLQLILVGIRQKPMIDKLSSLIVKLNNNPDDFTRIMKEAKDYIKSINEEVATKFNTPKEDDKIPILQQIKRNQKIACNVIREYIVQFINIINHLDETIKESINSISKKLKNMFGDKYKEKIDNINNEYNKLIQQQKEFLESKIDINLDDNTKLNEMDHLTNEFYKIVLSLSEWYYKLNVEPLLDILSEQEKTRNSINNNKQELSINNNNKQELNINNNINKQKLNISNSLIKTNELFFDEINKLLKLSANEEKFNTAISLIDDFDNMDIPKNKEFLNNSIFKNDEHISTSGIKYMTDLFTFTMSSIYKLFNSKESIYEPSKKLFIRFYYLLFAYFGYEFNDIDNETFKKEFMESINNIRNNYIKTNNLIFNSVMDLTEFKELKTSKLIIDMILDFFKLSEQKRNQYISIFKQFKINNITTEVINEKIKEIKDLFIYSLLKVNKDKIPTSYVIFDEDLSNVIDDNSFVKDIIDYYNNIFKENNNYRSIKAIIDFINLYKSDKFNSHPIGQILLKTKKASSNSFDDFKGFMKNAILNFIGYLNNIKFTSLNSFSLIETLDNVSKYIDNIDTNEYKNFAKIASLLVAIDDINKSNNNDNEELKLKIISAVQSSISNISISNIITHELINIFRNTKLITKNEFDYKYGCSIIILNNILDIIEILRYNMWCYKATENNVKEFRSFLKGGTITLTEDEYKQLYTSFTRYLLSKSYEADKIHKANYNYEIGNNGSIIPTIMKTIKEIETEYTPYNISNDELTKSINLLLSSNKLFDDAYETIKYLLKNSNIINVLMYDHQNGIKTTINRVVLDMIKLTNRNDLLNIIKASYDTYLTTISINDKDNFNVGNMIKYVIEIINSILTYATDLIINNNQNNNNIKDYILTIRLNAWRKNPLYRETEALKKIIKSLIIYDLEAIKNKLSEETRKILFDIYNVNNETLGKLINVILSPFLELEADNIFQENKKQVNNNYLSKSNSILNGVLIEIHTHLVNKFLNDQYSSKKPLIANTTKVIKDVVVNASNIIQEIINKIYTLLCIINPDKYYSFNNYMSEVNKIKQVIIKPDDNYNNHLNKIINSFIDNTEFIEDDTEFINIPCYRTLQMINKLSDNKQGTKQPLNTVNRSFKSSDKIIDSPVVKYQEFCIRLTYLLLNITSSYAHIGLDPKIYGSRDTRYINAYQLKTIQEDYETGLLSIAAKLSDLTPYDANSQWFNNSKLIISNAYKELSGNISKQIQIKLDNIDKVNIDRNDIINRDNNDNKIINSSNELALLTSACYSLYMYLNSGLESEEKIVHLFETCLIGQSLILSVGDISGKALNDKYTYNPFTIHYMNQFVELLNHSLLKDTKTFNEMCDFAKQDIELNGALFKYNELVLTMYDENASRDHQDKLLIKANYNNKLKYKEGTNVNKEKLLNRFEGPGFIKPNYNNTENLTLLRAEIPTYSDLSDVMKQKNINTEWCGHYSNEFLPTNISFIDNDLKKFAANQLIIPGKGIQTNGLSNNINKLLNDITITSFNSCVKLLESAKKEIIIRDLMPQYGSNKYDDKLINTTNSISTISGEIINNAKIYIQLILVLSSYKHIFKDIGNTKILDMNWNIAEVVKLSLFKLIDGIIGVFTSKNKEKLKETIKSYFMFSLDENTINEFVESDIIKNEFSFALSKNELIMFAFFIIGLLCFNVPEFDKIQPKLDNVMYDKKLNSSHYTDLVSFLQINQDFKSNNGLKLNFEKVLNNLVDQIKELTKYQQPYKILYNEIDKLNDVYSLLSNGLIPLLMKLINKPFINIDKINICSAFSLRQDIIEEQKEYKKLINEIPEKVNKLTEFYNKVVSKIQIFHNNFFGNNATGNLNADEIQQSRNYFEWITKICNDISYHLITQYKYTINDFKKLNNAIINVSNSCNVHIYNDFTDILECVGLISKFITSSERIDHLFIISYNKIVYKQLINKMLSMLYPNTNSSDKALNAHMYLKNSTCWFYRSTEIENQLLNEKEIKTDEYTILPLIEDATVLINKPLNSSTELSLYDEIVLFKQRFQTNDNPTIQDYLIKMLGNIEFSNNPQDYQKYYYHEKEFKGGNRFNNLLLGANIQDIIPENLTKLMIAYNPSYENDTQAEVKKVSKRLNTMSFVIQILFWLLVIVIIVLIVYFVMKFIQSNKKNKAKRELFKPKTSRYI